MKKIHVPGEDEEYVLCEDLEEFYVWCQEHFGGYNKFIQATGCTHEDLDGRYFAVFHNRVYMLRKEEVEGTRQYKALLKTREDLRWGDDDIPFEIKLDEDTLAASLIRSPERGDFKLVNLTYGFEISGFGGENAITVIFAGGTNQTDFIGISASPCEKMVTVTLNAGTTIMGSEEEERIVNDLVNRLYFM